MEMNQGTSGGVKTEKEKNRSIKKTILITSVVTLGIGLIQVIIPRIVLNIFDYLVAGIFIVFALSNLGLYFFKSKQESKPFYKLLYGIVFLLLGIYLMIHKGFAVKIIGLIFGLLIIMNAVLSLHVSLESKKQNLSRWKILLGFAAVNLILGCVVLFFPFATALKLIFYTGIMMIVSAALNFISIIFNKGDLIG